MVDATALISQASIGLSPEILRARAQRRRDTAARVWDERLERLLLEEADELERRAAALELEIAIRSQEDSAQARAAQPDIAALRPQPMKRR